MVGNTKYNSTRNGDLSLLSCVDGGSFVRSDDAVETFKRHAQYEQSAACVPRVIDIWT